MLSTDARDLIPPTPSQYYQLYWQHYERYLISRNAPEAKFFLNDLYLACQYLVTAMLLNNEKARSVIKRPLKLLAHELPKVCDTLFLEKLKEIPPESRHYSQAQKVYMDSSVAPALSKEEIDAQVGRVYCSKKQGRFYQLNISFDELRNSSKPIIFFIDESKSIEIAQFIISQQAIHFIAYGDPICINIKGILDVPACVFNNPKGELTLNTDCITKNSIYLAGDVGQFNFNGRLQTLEQVRIDIRGKIIVTADAIIQSKLALGFRADALELHGKLQSEASTQLDVQTAIVMGPEGECSSQTATVISAGALKDIRGRITSEGIVKVEVSDGVYLHGAAALHGKTGLMVKAKSMMATDKASVKTEGPAQIQVSTVVVDKESDWSVNALMMRGDTFKNYSPHFKANKALIRSEDRAINYPTGVITINGLLQLLGGSVWNGGSISYGQLEVKLNQLFVHGISDLSELSHLRKVINQAKLQGGDTSIVAGLVLDILGSKTIRKLNVAAIAEINIGLTTARNSSKSRLIALDAGLDMPNIASLCEDVSQFCRIIQNRDYEAFKNIVFSMNTLMNATSFARWIVRMLLPVAGKSVDLVWNAFFLIYSTPKLYTECQKLYQREEKVESSDLYSLLAKASNFASQGMTLESQLESWEDSYFQKPTEGTPSSEESKAAAEPKASEPKADGEPAAPVASLSIDEVVPSLALDFALLFLPSNTDEAVLGTRIGGVHASTNVMNRTGFSFEMWRTQLGLNVSDIFYTSVQQQSVAVAGTVSEVGHTLDRSGVTVAVKSVANVVEQKERGVHYAQAVEWLNETLDEKADVTARKITVHSDRDLKHEGDFDANEIRLSAKTVNTSAESKITAEKGVAVIEGVQTTVEGDAKAAVLEVKASGHLEISDTAHLSSSAPKGIIVLEGSTASVKGSVEAYDVSYRADHIPNVEDLLLRNGIYKSIIATGILRVWTKDEINLDRDIDLSYSFTLSGSRINVSANLHSLGDIGLDSRDSDVNIKQHAYTVQRTVPIYNSRRSPGFHAPRLGQAHPPLTKTITETHYTPISINADGILSVSSHGAFYNDRGTLSGNEVYVDTQGNIVNHGGTLSATTYLQLHSVNGDIVNECIETDVQGQYDIMKHYDIGHMLGGTGAGHDGVGFAVFTGGKFINDASEVSSIGSNHISADKGVVAIARSHRYLSFSRDNTTWYGKRTVKRDYSTQVQSSLIYSSQGKNIIETKSGTIYSCATQFIAPGETTLIAPPGQVILDGIVADQEQYKSSGYFGGLIGTETRQRDQFAVPTQIVSGGDVHIESGQNVLLANAMIFTPGKLTFTTPQVDVSAPILQHSYTELSRGFSVEGPGSYQSLVPMYSDYQALSKSRGSSEWAASSWNALVDGANTLNGLLSAVRSGSFMQAVVPKSSISVGDIDHSRTLSQYRWQTVAGNVGIHCGSFEYDDKEGEVAFENGVPVIVSGDATLIAKRLMQSGAALSSSAQINSQHMGIGVSATGDPTVSVGISASRAKAVNYANQLFQVGGALCVSLQEWKLDSANTVAEKLTGHADTLSAISRCDTSSSYSRSAGVDTTGNFSYQQSSSQSALIDMPSGVRVIGETDFDASSVYLEGGKVLVGNGNGPTSVLSKPVQEYSKTSSYGFGGNVNDLFNQGLSGHGSWNRAIPTVGVQRGEEDYQASQLGTIWSAKGGMSGTPTISGEIDTTDSDGLRVSCQTQSCYQVKIPLYRPEGLKQSKDDEALLEGKLHPTPKPSSSYSVSEKRSEHKKQSPSDDEDFITSVEETASAPIPRVSLVYPHGVTMFGESSSDAKEEKDSTREMKTMSRVERWTTSPPASSKWRQLFWDEIDALDRHDDAAVRIMSRVIDEVNPRSIWARVNGHRSDEQIANGDIFSQQSLKDLIDVGSDAGTFAPIGRGIKLVGEGLAAGITKFGVWRSAAVSEKTLSPADQLAQAMEEAKVYEQLGRVDVGSVNAAEALRSKLSVLENLQYTADKIETLSNGSIRYFGVFRPASKPGETIGARFVVEHNSLTGEVFTWNEMYNSLGEVNRIHLKGVNGIQMAAPHFPLTLQEILEKTIDQRSAFNYRR